MQSVEKWLSDWERAIRERDFKAGGALFCENASGFGTVTERTRTRAELIDQQWRKVWPRTQGFAFDQSDLSITMSPDSLMAVAHARWTSDGADENGNPRKRAGRCTVALVRDGSEGQWRCLHTHFSMWPHAADQALMNHA